MTLWHGKNYTNLCYLQHQWSHTSCQHLHQRMWSGSCPPLYWTVQAHAGTFLIKTVVPACFKLRSNRVKTRDFNHYSSGTGTWYQLQLFQNSKCQIHPQQLLWAALKSWFFLYVEDKFSWTFLRIKTRLEEKDIWVFIWLRSVWFWFRPVPSTVINIEKYMTLIVWIII